ncbi:MAG: FtsB family cell division protein [Rhodospirillales bacterium]
MKKAAFRWAGAIVIAAIGALFLGLRVPRSLASLNQKHQQIRQLQRENADLAREVAEKQERIRKLRSSRSEQELEVRKRLKLQREGETSIILEQTK